MVCFKESISNLPFCSRVSAQLKWDIIKLGNLHIFCRFKKSHKIHILHDYTLVFLILQISQVFRKEILWCIASSKPETIGKMKNCEGTKPSLKNKTVCHKALLLVLMGTSSLHFCVLVLCNCRDLVASCEIRHKNAKNETSSRLINIGAENCL